MRNKEVLILHGDMFELDEFNQREKEREQKRRRRRLEKQLEGEKRDAR